MRKLTLTPNVPVDLDVRYLDVVTGEFGAQLRFKGKLADSDEAVMLYLTHDTALDQLVLAKALHPLKEYDVERVPEKGVSLSMKAKQLTFLAEQLEGQRRPKLRITVRGQAFEEETTAAAGAAAAVTAPAPAGDTPAPAIAGTTAATAARYPGTIPCGPTYLRAFDYANDVVLPYMRARGVFVGSDYLQSVTTTLFIQLCREER